MREDTFKEFFISNYQRTIAFAISLVKNEEVAKDIVHDAFEQLYHSGLSLSEEELRNYLYRTLRNKCADYYRRISVHDKYSEYVLRFASKAETAEEHDNKIDEVLGLIEKLSPKTREVLTSHYLKGNKYREIAKELDISESAVKKHIIKGLKFIRENMIKIFITWCLTYQ